MISHTGKAWVILLCVLLMPIATYAQILTGLERPLNLTMNPAYPTPGDTVTLTIQSYGVDLDRSLVTWYADNKEIAHGESMKETSIAAGKLGSATRITVIAEEPGGLIGSAEATVRPSIVDLLWESDSYVPPYFRGRAFPSAGTAMRAHAVVQFVDAQGKAVPESNIIYTWTKGSTRVASGRGRSSISIPGSAFLGDETLTVTAESTDGTQYGRASARPPSTEPVLELYENHPLFGVLYHRALTGSVSTLERELKVTAVPYFAHLSSLRDADLIYEWEADGLKLRPDPNQPETLTITSNGYTGPANISLSLTSSRNWFLETSGAWQIVFSESGSFFGTDIDPFAPRN